MIPSEVQYLLAAPNATAGYSLPGTVYNSNGNYCSTTQVNVSVAQNNIFPDITGAENAALQVDYQCIFVYNSDLSASMVNAIAWIPVGSVTSGAVTWAIAPDPTGVSAYNTISQQALAVANPLTAPVGISSWTAPSSTVSGGISLGTIGPRQVRAMWIRRTATGVAAASAAFTLQVTFDV